MVCEEKEGAERLRSYICGGWILRPHNNAGRTGSTDTSPGSGLTKSTNINNGLRTG